MCGCCVSCPKNCPVRLTKYYTRGQNDKAFRQIWERNDTKMGYKTWIKASRAEIYALMGFHEWNRSGQWGTEGELMVLVVTNS